MRIFALHGFTGAGEDFGLLRQCCPPAWQWHCPDLPGHGANAMVPAEGQFSLPAYLDFLEGERTRASPSHPCILLGYSMGGRIALHWALKNPAAFAALILIGASPGIADAGERAKRQAADEALAGRIMTEGIPAFQQYWWSLPLFSGLRKLPPEELSRLKARRRENTASGLAASLKGVGTGALSSLWDQLPLIKLPVLCLAGGLDEKFAGIASQMASQLARGTATLIPGAGHVAHLEASREVARNMQKFGETNLTLDR